MQSRASRRARLADSICSMRHRDRCVPATFSVTSGASRPRSQTDRPPNSIRRPRSPRVHRMSSAPLRLCASASSGPLCVLVARCTFHLLIAPARTARIACHGGCGVADNQCIWQHVPAETWRSPPALERLAPGRLPDRHDTPICTSRPCAGCRRSPRPTPSFHPVSTLACAARWRAAAFHSSTPIRRESIEHALAGRHVVVITPTASGKTLCYNGPVLDAVPRGSVEPRAVSVSDQGARAGSARRAAGLVRDARPGRCDEQIGVFTYDGDTPQDARRTIRGRAHLVLSNPDMLHSGILPHHPRWAKLFENLRYVVIDELHAYRGVFGSHLCNVLRRLRRICRHYGSNPVFLCSSATIANPRELAERLTEQSVRARRAERRAARREVLRVRQSAGGQPPARDQAFVPQRDAADCLGVPQAEPSAHRLCPEPAVDRDPHDLSEGRFRRDPRPGRSGSAAIAADICRTGAGRSRRACARAPSAPWCPPTRWSSASTSAPSTLR